MFTPAMAEAAEDVVKPSFISNILKMTGQKISVWNKLFMRRP
jgi:hypothetical protein